MKILVLCSILFALSLPVNAQYCLNVGPTSNADSNVESVTLIGNGNSIIYTGCPGVLGLEEQTNMMATLTAGNNYTLNIQFGTCGGNYGGIGEAWIDFNKNNIFELNESVGTWNGTPPTNLSSFNINLPINSINGLTRMRIIQREGGSLPIDPCGTFQWGSASDFSIDIVGGVDCSGYPGNTASDPIHITTVPYSNTIDNSYCYFSNSEAYPSPDVFFLLKTDSLVQSVTVSLCGSSFDTFLSVFDKFGNTISYNDDNINCGNQSEVSFNINNRDSIFIVVEGWGDEQGEFDINVSGQFLGVSNLSKNSFELFPNPAYNFFYIKGISTQKMKLYDVMGNLVQTINYIKDSKIKTDHLAAGYYLINFNHDGVSHTNSLIIK